METPLELSADELATIIAAAPPGVAVLIEALLLRSAQLESLLVQQQQTIEQQQQATAVLTARLQQFTDQLSRTSHNSHQPPASDGFNKKPRSLRQRSGKRLVDKPVIPARRCASATTLTTRCSISPATAPNAVRT